MKKLISYLMIGLSLAVLAACSSATQAPVSDPEIAGKLDVVQLAPETTSVGTAFEAEVKDALPVVVDAGLNTLGDKPTLVPGELIIKYKDGTLSTQAVLRVNGISLKRSSATLIQGASLYRASNLSEAETLELAKRIAARADVEYAIPNYLKYPSLIPDDTNYSLQWHYPAIRMPEVWDFVTGTNVVVAVVDTGIYFTQGVAAGSHPDLFGKVLPGYDFVSDATNSGDNDGLDANPFDNNLENGHGTHVAGTIAAATNNGRDVAGINWSAQILPVRVLGLGGGSTLDIMQGALWAAGGSVPGVPPNPNPAQVINMSLGGKGVCTPYEQAIFNQIYSLGAIVVVAAGNENDDANRYSPSSCSGVITVGATDAKGDRSYYSNYGPKVDIMAPGGDVTADVDANGVVDGVLSLGFDMNSGNFSLSLKQGTSMAAPHVTGVISLMKGLNPALTASDALAILRATANPLTPASCQRTTGRDCGAGLINAFAAIQAVGKPTVPAEAGQTIAFNPNPVDFGSSSSELQLTLTNTSSSPASFSISDVNWLSTNPTPFITNLVGGSTGGGTIPAGASETMTVWLDRSLLTEAGVYAFEYKFIVNGKEQLLLGRFKHGELTDNPTGATLVASFLMDENDELIVDDNGQFIIGGAQLYQTYVDEYTYKAIPGNHLVIAWVDENTSGEIDSGDYIGVFQDGVLITEKLGKDNVDVDIARSFGTTSTSKTISKLNSALEQVFQSLH
ncbi:MAG: S8 family peptidase [Trueperaceae bacterium]|nr:S8 family peptidase [Trueperaceae bacterium]